MPSRSDLQYYYGRSITINKDTGRQKQQLDCLICGRFRTHRLTNMHDHVCNHLQLKQYKCQRCGHGFNQSGNLTRHLRSNICRSKGGVARS